MHCVLEFNQSQWFWPYIDCNTQKRIQAEKNGGKDIQMLYTGKLWKTWEIEPIQNSWATKKAI